MTRECLRAALPGLSGFGGHRARQIHQMLLPPPKQVRRADARREIMSEIAPQHRTCHGHIKTDAKDPQQTNILL